MKGVEEVVLRTILVIDRAAWRSSYWCRGSSGLREEYRAPVMDTRNVYLISTVWRRFLVWISLGGDLDSKKGGGGRKEREIRTRSLNTSLTGLILNVFEFAICGYVLLATYMLCVVVCARYCAAFQNTMISFSICFHDCKRYSESPPSIYAIEMNRPVLFLLHK